ncbi:MAG: glycosyltransferase family 4 protein [Brevundimonas sp.]|uniref:glycosyltransferase family 4 protein n=1 Tax=Brevundimonas sp. TaxID=1871086 RepID=UPI003919B6CF
MKTLCIDGYNLALARGTGIATYGRSLLEAGKALGMRTEAVFGPAVPRSRSNLINETNLVGPAAASQKRSLVQRVERRLEKRIGSFGAKVWPIDISGEVLWPEARGGMPDVDALWAGDNLFHRAGRTFRDHGRSIPLSFDVTLDRPKPDIMHWTIPMALHAPGCANIYTIHDLIPLKAPHTTTTDRKAFIALHNQVARHADHIAVVSEATRQDVIALLGVSPERVTNTYQTLSMPPLYTSRPIAEVASNLEGVFGLEWENYFIHFGAIEPKKNLGRIVEAYLASGSKRPLVVVGGRGWLQEDETALLKQALGRGSEENQRIRVYDYLTQSSLVDLIRGARALLFPSLYEGFGLPVLEAMALGTAVLTSRSGALPEVAGDAAIAVEAESVDSIKMGIRALDADDDLVAELTHKGILQAAKFSTEAYAERLNGMYSKLQ